MIRRLRRGRGFIAALSLSALMALPAGAQSLTDAMIAAYQNSGLLEQNRALLRAADEDVAQAVSALRPVIDYVASVNYRSPSAGDEITSSAGIQGSLLLYDFGRSQLAIDAQKETVLALREALRGVEQQVLLRAISAFLNVRRQTAFVSLRDNNVRVITEQLRAARDRFEVGEVTRTDVAIAEARLAAARSALLAAQGALAQASAEYRAATGGAPATLRQPPALPDIPASRDAAQAVARDRHPDLKEAQRNVTVAEMAIAIAEAALRPSFNATGSVTVDDDFDDTTSLGLSLSGPIYRGGSLTSRIRQAQANRDASRAALYSVTLGIDQGVANAWADLEVARAGQTASTQEVRAARIALEGAREELQVGARTTLDVLDREQELLDAETNLVSAQIDGAQAVYQLLASMGLLTVDHMGLGIATYDPAAYYRAVADAPTRMVSPQGEKLDRVLQRLNRQ